MLTRARLTLGTALLALVLVALVVPTAQAAAKVPRVTGLTAAGSNAASAVLGVRWKKVARATYQVRWAQSTAKLRTAKVYPTAKTSAWSPVLSSICTAWYAQVRAKKGAKLGAWSAPKALRFTVPKPKVPTPQTGVQTSSSQAQVRWTRSPGAAGYRLDWSPAPFGNWPGLEHVLTPYTAPSATGTAVTLPALGGKDHFVNAAYGNPIFAQLNVKRCDGTFAKSTYFPIYAKPFPAGSGDALRFGTYNVELAPTQAQNPERIAALADNIESSGAKVLALQEASSTTVADLKAALAALGQGDWDDCGVGSQQQILFRTTAWTEVSCTDVGMAADGTAEVPSDAAGTPLPTPAARLTPAVADPTRRDIIVVSVHLEDRKKFYADPEHPPSIAEQKKDAHDAAQILVDKIAVANPEGLPVLAAGDFKGNFGGGAQPPGAGYCDASSTPMCEHEGQPTFIRAGYLDARAAVTRSGADYATVNGHKDGAPVRAASGVGSRADFIVVRGFSGISRYVNLYQERWEGLPLRPPNNLTAGGTPTDHNLVYADLFVPQVP